MATVVRFLVFLVQALPSLGLLQSPNIRELYRFPNGTWLENIAVRPNGNLLITDATTSSLWEITPSTDSIRSSPRLVHHFDEAKDMGGIAELTPDTYAVIASNSVWKIDLSKDRHSPSPVRIADIPAGFLNGMAALDGGNAVVISDSRLGLVWYLNVQSGNYSISHQHETMQANSDLGMLIGVNGLKIMDDYMYYSNSPKQIFCRVRIDTRTSRAMGPYEVISYNTLADDFAIDSRGIGYLASLTNNEIIKVYPDGLHEVVAGAEYSRVLMSATAAAFGRTQSDRHVLYVTTGGETEHPVNDTASLGGKVMAVFIGARDELHIRGNPGSGVMIVFAEEPGSLRVCLNFFGLDIKNNEIPRGWQCNGNPWILGHLHHVLLDSLRSHASLDNRPTPNLLCRVAFVLII